MNLWGSGLTWSELCTQKTPENPIIYSLSNLLKLESITSLFLWSPIQKMLSYTLLFLAALATAQKATTWPPSLPEYDPHVNTQCNSSPTIPKSFFEELQSYFNDPNSLISGLIQAACDPNCEKSILYGSCSGNDYSLTALWTMLGRKSRSNAQNPRDKRTR